MGQSSIRKPNASISGFTLLELSVVILILGTTLAAVATAYQSYKLQKDQEITQTRTANAAEKVDEYRRIKGAYPAPASLEAARTDANYGISAPNTASSGCNNGVCVQTATGTNATGTVQIGAIPFRELNLPEEETYDAYGSRIVYAVTSSLIDKNNFNETKGGIEIKNETGSVLTSQPGSGHYLFSSPGKNKLGAFNINGQNTVPCTGAGADVANCDFLTGATEARYTSNSRSETNDAAGAASANYFDDTLAFNVPKERSLWRRAATEGDHVNDLVDMSENNIVMSSQRNAGSADAALSILFDNSNSVYDGSLYVAGWLKSESMCPADDPTKCFRISDFTTNCPVNQYVVGIYDGRIQCGTIYFGCKNPDGTADHTKYLKGVDSAGQPICDPIPTPQPGACGSADTDNVLLISQPAPAALCTNDSTPSAVIGNGYPWTWSCRGAHYGSRVSCEAEMVRPVNGQCGVASDGRTFPANHNFDQPDLCAQGSVANLSGNGPWSWSCTGSPSQGSVAAGTTANCSSGVSPSDASCGTNIDTCTTGTFQSEADSPSQSLWTCLGQYGGQNRSCSAGLACTPGPTD